MSNSIYYDKDRIIVDSNVTNSISSELRAANIYPNGHKVITLENLQSYDDKIKEYIAEQLNLVKENKKQYIKMYDGEDY